MARKFFISYKYSEAQSLRDTILKALGSDGSYYQGETSESPDLTDTSTENIKINLADMMYQTSVLIVIISPSIKQSKWIDWEIEYCLKEISRQGRTSKTNGIVGVVMKVNGNCDWIKNHLINCHGTPTIQFKNEYLYPIIYKNLYNSKPPLRHCSQCNTYDSLNGSYINLIDEDSFLLTPIYYIENAYDKSEEVYKFELTKQK